MIVVEDWLDRDDSAIFRALLRYPSLPRFACVLPFAAHATLHTLTPPFSRRVTIPPILEAIALMLAGEARRKKIVSPHRSALILSE
jgi:hypothetical protein